MDDWKYYCIRRRDDHLKTIITCAVTGASTRKDQTPYLPITPVEIANSALEAAKAGAAIVHLHVRDPETGNPSMNFKLYEEVVCLIREQNDKVLINLTTGPGAQWFPTPGNLSQGSHHSLLLGAAERVNHVVKLRPDLCSIDFNTMNQSSNGVRINHKLIIKEMIKMIQDAGVKPELELFDSGDLVLAKEFYQEGIIRENPFWQFAMGIKYGWTASTNTLMYAHRELPLNAIWSAFGIGKTEMPILAQSSILGGHVRVGLEDNIYTKRGTLAKSNAELVEMAVNIIELLGGNVATPDDARSLLLII
jgi:uncharacterized protein (DUF849 family)